MYQQKMLRRKALIENQILELEEEIKKLPVGDLHWRRNGKYVKWYKHYGGRSEYISKNHKELIQQMAIKKYKTELIKELQTEKLAIDTYMMCRGKKDKTSAELLKEDSVLRKYLSPYFEEDNEIWMKEKFESNMSHPEHLIHKTVAGINVRSKSESLIVSALYLQHIPFRYECALRLGEVIMFPDFTIKHPFTNKIYYWEHFGMMDNPDYVRMACKKIQIYSENGIIPSVNLIMTYETQSNPLDYDMLDNLIQFYFK